ncbi:MAG: DUF6020 family protein [Coriobacteriales bacterium]|jgi:hypothetical protein|nr:DUF6020 family protein [Coriobacteriales bacterium]
MLMLRKTAFKTACLRLPGAVFGCRRQNLILALNAALLAAATVFVLPAWFRGNINQYAEGGIGLAVALAQFAGLGLAIFAVLSFLTAFAPQFLRWLDRFEPLHALPISWERRSVLVDAAILFICYIPWLILLYPGGAAYDAVAQVFQIEGSGALRPEVYEGTPPGWVSDTHPVLHTLLLAIFFKAGVFLGSQNLGLFFYCVFQAAVQAVCFSIACSYLNRLSVPKILRIASLAFFALYPAVASSTAIIFKDHIFSPLYVLYFIGVIHIVQTRAACLARRRNLVALIVICLLLAMLKKTGLHVVVLTGLVLLVVYRRHFKGLLLAVAAPLAMLGVIYPAVIFPLFHVVPGGFQEVMGPLLQQTARVVTFKGSEIPKAEREAIDKVVPYVDLDHLYQPTISDHVKGNFHQRATASDLAGYLAVWASQGLRYPQLYAEATLDVISPYLIPYAAWEIDYNLPPRDQKFWIDWVTRQERYRNNNVKYLSDQVDFGSVSELYPAKRAVRDITTGLSQMPVLFLFFSMGFYVLWLPSIGFSVQMRYRPRDALTYLPVLVSFLILLLSPFAMSRYALPLLESAPLILGLAVMACRCPEKPVVDFSMLLATAPTAGGESATAPATASEPPTKTATASEPPTTASEPPTKIATASESDEPTVTTASEPAAGAVKEEEEP